MSNYSYWKERLGVEAEELIYKTEFDTIEQLQKLYGKALRETISDIQTLYNKITRMKKNGGVITMNDFYQYDRYWKLQSELNKRLMELGIKEASIDEKEFIKMYELTCDLIKDKLPMNYISPKEKAERAINQIWCADGKTFKDRIFGAKSQFQGKINTILTDGVQRGLSVDEITQNLNIEFGNEEASNRRLVRTELSHFYNEAARDSYEAAGITHYQLITADSHKKLPLKLNQKPRESRVCEQCASYDKRIYPINDLEHMPPIHPNCMCVIIPVIPERYKESNNV